MFLPYNTDAPLYHPPIATGVLIAVNCVAFGLTLAHPEAAEAFILEHGNGLHPIQWVTSAFLHADAMHLLGNMIFLWAFGLLVEGKIGWLRMAGLYLGIGIVQNIFEQTIALGMNGGGSLGASSAIFGLMAMSVVWAPKNEMSCVVFFRFRPFFFAMPVLGLVGLYLILNIVMAFIDGRTISTQTLHLMGAVLGFGVGIAMVKVNWVDCENWDIFSVIAGRHEMTDEQLRELKEQSAEYQREQQKQHDSLVESTQRNVRALIGQGRPDTALSLYQKVAPRLGDWHLPERDMLGLIAALHRQRNFSESIPLMVEYLQNYTARTVAVRLNLAQIVLVEERRPAQSLSVLAKLDAALLDEKQRSLFARLQARAEKAKEEGAYDYAEHDW
ncbi:MAG TPA: rhomboid family intramembrane serine protease [Thermoguttaceae bacterium]|nr:rhomboid family intramembrane serine protease [Thermoguttaceae bacterium]